MTFKTSSLFKSAIWLNSLFKTKSTNNTISKILIRLSELISPIIKLSILISKNNGYIQASSKKYAKIIDEDGAKIQSKKIEFFKNDSIINFTKDVLFKKNN